ncbi:hypothetical protein [Streptomyces cucumeris]|uniref:hypothetical protein n=1 Tax=Streptomyces cucumeris TaxID=2962890 RepID=UPI003D7230D4
MNNSDTPPKTMHPEQAIKIASKLSSDLYDMVRLQGKVSPAGPGAATGNEKERDYAVQHFWSISQLPPKDLTRGFNRLRDELPKKGWRVTHSGPANSTARQLEIEAVHEKDEYSLSVELLIRSTRKDQSSHASKDDRIRFSVGSPTYRAPEGVDPDDYY